MVIKADALKDYSVFTINSFLFLTLACLLTFKIMKIKVMGRFVLRKQQSIVLKRLIFLKQDLLKGGVHQFPSRFIEIRLDERISN